MRAFGRRPAPRRRPAAGAGAQLFPRAARRAGDLRRGHAGERAADGAHAAAHPALRLVCRGGLADPGRRRMAGCQSVVQPARDHRNGGGPGHLSKRSPRRRRSIRSTMPTCRACCRCWTPPASSRPRPRPAVRLLAGFDLSQTAKLRGGAEGVYRHALGLRAAAAPDLAAGSPDAGLLHAAGIPVRGDARLPDARRPGPARQVAGEGVDDLRLAGPVFRARQSGGDREPPARIWMRSWRSPLPAVPLDDALVAKARTTFSRVSLASRAYSRIKPSAAAQSLPPWRPSDALGRAGGSVFTSASGRKLSDGIPGFLTVDGFHKVSAACLGHGDARSRVGKLGAGAEGARQLRPLQAKRGRERGRQAVHGGLRQGVGRPAAGSRDRAAAQPEPGVPGPLYPGVQAVAVEGSAGGHRPPAHAVGAAEAFGCRGGGSSGSGKGGQGQGGGSSAHGGEVRGACRTACRPGRRGAGACRPATRSTNATGSSASWSHRPARRRSTRC